MISISDELLINSDCIQEKTLSSITHLKKLCHGLSQDAGWWSSFDSENILEVPSRLMLVVSEISEAMEGHRKQIRDEHLPNYSSLEVELADALIRIFDMAGGLGLRIEQAMLEKMLYNIEREDHKQKNRQSTNGKKY